MTIVSNTRYTFKRLTRRRMLFVVVDVSKTVRIKVSGQSVEKSVPSTLEYELPQ